MLEFSKISKNVFCASAYDIKNGRKDSLYKMVDDTRIVSVLDCLYNKVDGYDEINISINELVKKIGYTPNQNKGKVNDKVADILKKLQEQNYIEVITGDLNKISSPSQLLQFKIADGMFCKNDANQDNNYITLDTKEKNAITNSINLKDKIVKSSVLLLYYCYIKSKLHFKKNDSDFQTICCWFSFKKLEDELGIGRTTAIKYNKILTDLGMIKVKNAGYYKTKEGHISLTHNVYVLDKFSDDANTAEERLAHGIDEYLSFYKRLKQKQEEQEEIAISEASKGFTEDLFA